MDRPRSVEKVVDEKFKKLQEKKTEWVNMGSDVHQVRIGLDHVVDTDNLAARLLPLDDQTACLLDLGALLRKLFPNHESLFSGTANGKLLEHLHSELKIPFNRLVGVSAVDHRLGATIPDSSYHILNIDKLKESNLGKDSYKLVLSFATFYHLVDPVGALVEVPK